MWYSGQITEAQRIVGFVFMAGEEHRSDRVQIVVFMHRSTTVHSRWYIHQITLRKDTGCDLAPQGRKILTNSSQKGFRRGFRATQLRRGGCAAQISSRRTRSRILVPCRTIHSRDPHPHHLIPHTVHSHLTGLSLNWPIRKIC